MDNISLMPDIKAFLQHQITAGIYNSLSEAINANLQIVISKQEFPVKEMEALNAEIQKGIDDYKSGRYKDGETAIKELIAKYVAK